MKIEREPAEQELQRILDFFDLSPEGTDWESQKEKLISAIMKGRISLDEEKANIKLTLVCPLELQNGSTISEFVFKEPTAGDLKVMDRYKEGQNMAKTIALASTITSQPIGIIDRLVVRDLQTVAGIVSLFF